MIEIDKNALIALKVHRHELTWQEYKTLRGQVLAGEPDAAMKGLRRLLKRGGEIGERTE
jgi:hypothetical protein